MLELRPSCECCHVDLAPDSTVAMICSFECTFCRNCVDGVLQNVCPNCGGGFTPRPIRPSKNWKNENYLGKYPGSGRKVEKEVDADRHAAFANKIVAVAPENR